MTWFFFRRRRHALTRRRRPRSRHDGDIKEAPLLLEATLAFLERARVGDDPVLASGDGYIELEALHRACSSSSSLLALFVLDIVASDQRRPSWRAPLVEAGREIVGDWSRHSSIDFVRCWRLMEFPFGGLVALFVLLDKR